MSLGKNEQKYVELRDQFLAELKEIDEEIRNLRTRKDLLISILDGSYTVEEDSTDPEEDFSREQSLSLFIHENGPTKRAEITTYAEHYLGMDDPKEITRLLERCKRRGLIQVEGKSKAAVWTAVN